MRLKHGSEPSISIVDDTKIVGYGLPCIVKVNHFSPIFRLEKVFNLWDFFNHSSACKSSFSWGGHRRRRLTANTSDPSCVANLAHGSWRAWRSPCGCRWSYEHPLWWSLFLRPPASRVQEPSGLHSLLPIFSPLSSQLPLKSTGQNTFDDCSTDSKSSQFARTCLRFLKMNPNISQIELLKWIGKDDRKLQPRKGEAILLFWAQKLSYRVRTL